MPGCGPQDRKGTAHRIASHRWALGSAPACPSLVLLATPSRPRAHSPPPAPPPPPHQPSPAPSSQLTPHGSPLHTPRPGQALLSDATLQTSISLGGTQPKVHSRLVLRAGRDPANHCRRIAVWCNSDPREHRDTLGGGPCCRTRRHGNIALAKPPGWQIGAPPA